MSCHINKVNAADRYLLDLPEAVLGTVLNEWVDNNKVLAKLDIAYVNKNERPQLKEVSKEYVSVKLKVNNLVLSGYEILSVVKYIYENYKGIKIFNVAWVNKERITDGDVDTIIQYILSPERRHFPLEYLDCTDKFVDLSAVDLKKATKLNVVVLNSWKMDGPHLTDHHFKGINELKSLTVLNIKGPDISGLVFLKPGYDSLKALDIENCENIDFKNLIKCNENLKKITSLDISFTHITDEELKDLLQNFKNITNLAIAMCINLTENGFEYVGIGRNLKFLDAYRNFSITDTSVIGIIERSPFLENLNVFGSPFLTKAAFQDIGNLKVLDISECPLITMDDKKKLADHHPGLKLGMVQCPVAQDKIET